MKNYTRLKQQKKQVAIDLEAWLFRLSRGRLALIIFDRLQSFSHLPVKVCEKGAIINRINIYIFSCSGQKEQKTKTSPLIHCNLSSDKTNSTARACMKLLVFQAVRSLSLLLQFTVLNANWPCFYIVELNCQLFVVKLAYALHTALVRIIHKIGLFEQFNRLWVQLINFYPFFMMHDAPWFVNKSNTIG